MFGARGAIKGRETTSKGRDIGSNEQAIEQGRLRYEIGDQEK